MRYSIETRLLFEFDIPAAMALKEAAGWNQTEADWRRLLSLEPNGCFAAVKDGRLVGTTTTTVYDKLAWIGMVLVEPQHRRQGIAAQLMRVALNYLKDKVTTIKLDATALGQPVYERFGFEVESEVERWTGNANGSAAQTASDMDREALLDLDRLAFNGNRSKLIELLIADASTAPILIKAADGTLLGYALARSGTSKTYVGPVVARDAHVIETLLDRMLSQLAGREVYIDINKECIDDTRVLSERGFVKERDLIRMVKGGPSQKTSPLVVAIAGPEVG
jgi:ribosomal protein S18 acetylase RimI-like enzyme